MAFLWVTHARFPFTLDVMEFAVLQHVMRVLQHQPIYDVAQPGFVALAYNPLYYFAALPMIRLLGPSLFALRLFSIFAALGCAAILYRVVTGETRSAWWGLLTVGLFAAAYRAMDAYLETAHSDSWMIFTALLGTWLIGRNHSRLWNWAGLLLLVAAFWFKQHGAFFALGGALFLTWRDGWARSWMYWLALLLLGPALDFFAGTALFGPQFHYYTWEVPRGWSRLGPSTFVRPLMFFSRRYGVLLVSALLLILHLAWKDRRRVSAWHFQFPFAVLTALLGSLDRDSSNNVFIPLGVWTVLVGTLGLHTLVTRPVPARGIRLDRLAIFLSFALLFYDPRSVITSRRAGEQYADLIRMLRALPGSVYAPWIGQLPGDYRFVPAAHWAALDDMTRAGGGGLQATRVALAPAIHPPGRAYVLTNRPLGGYPGLDLLSPYYVLDADLGDRFAALRGLPRRWDHGWPRYLYRYAPDEAGARPALMGARPSVSGVD